MSKRLVNLLILLLVVSAAAAVLAAGNFSSETLVLEEIRLPEKAAEKLDAATLATWQSYRKEGFDFELKYPPILSYKYDSVWTPQDPSSPIKKTLNSVFEGDSFDMTLVLNAPNAWATSSQARFLRESKVSINGLSVPNKIFQEPNGDLISLVNFEKNSNLYLAWALITGDKENSLRTFRQILSTFKFTD